MLATYKLRDHSCYDNYTHKSIGDNVSDVIDAVLRVTVKITERYAGDVLFYLDHFRQAVEEKRPWKALLLFREGGSWELSITDTEAGETVEVSDASMYQQFWRLEYIPGNGAEFKRMDLTEVR